MEEEIQEIKFEVGVILPAAGSGERLNNATPKQYFEIMGKPLFLHSLEQFEEFPWIQSIVVVSDNPQQVEKLLKERSQGVGKVIVVLGGPTRHRSIQAGLDTLALLASPNCNVVVVHDAVRPLVPAKFLKQLVLEAHRYGASGATRPLISTVVARNKEGLLAETLDRTKFLNSETPQAFKTSVLTEAYERCSPDELDTGTECLQLVLRHCHIRAKLVEGPEELWKVTLRRDLHSAVGCITEITNKVCIFTPGIDITLKDDVISPLMSSLRWKVSEIKHMPGLYDKSVEINGHPQSFNNAIVFCDKPEEFPTAIETFINCDPQGTVVHVCQTKDTRDKVNLFKIGSHIIGKYSKFNKSVVIIFWMNLKRNKQLLGLINNTILAGNAFSGQVLFV